MNDKLTLANSLLLEPANLNVQLVEKILGQTLGRSVDEADVYLQCCREESWYLEDGIVKEGEFSIDRGFGLRVVSGEKTGFAYADHLDLSALMQAAQSAKSIVYSGAAGQVQMLDKIQPLPLYPDVDPLSTLSETQKVSLLQDVDRYARSLDPRVTQVFANLSGTYEVIWLLNSVGRLCADVRPLVALQVRVIVEQGKRREQGSCNGGARDGYQFFTTTNKCMQYAQKAVLQAIRSLEAIAAPAGTMPVVLGPGWPGILLHEAVGHGLEGDFNRKGSSAFSGKLGQKVASELCTIVDDGTIPGRRGSLTVDDEGTPTESTVLIKDGMLINYMQDRLNARLMKMQPTGNGRRESYAHLPLPRMTNTYMLPGKSDPQEIIASVKKGIYAVDFAGGQVDITSGKFVFVASEAYLIENGRITVPIKGATLMGNGPDILTKVSMVGNDLQLDGGMGTCGKAGQSVPVGVGQPTVKLEMLTVGGQR